jgi:SAM-dependent methyltransferase
VTTSAVNRLVYCSRLSVRLFSRTATEGLFPAERKCFELIPAPALQSVLDIGVGAGRTTRPLLAKFRDYTGIDYSERLVAVARRAFPTADLRVMDARSLQFDRKFDCVFFSWNGIDFVPYEDRRRIRRSIADVLRRNGYLIYSTHNLAYPPTEMFLKRLWVRELFWPWWRLRFVPMRLMNFWRQKGDLHGPFAYVNDASVGFRLLTVYVDIERELELLNDEGFEVCATIGQRSEGPGYGPNDAWVYMVARLR